MPFYNREDDIRRMKAVLSGEPNLVYFVYGPINSGKTALLNHVFDLLPDNYRIFYINFRGRLVQTVEDLVRVMFQVKRGIISERTRDFLKEVLTGGAKVLGKLKGIPIPENIFEILFKRVDKVEDIFAYLEDYFGEIVESNLIPVLVLDEIQTIKEIVNAKGELVLSNLFNFMVRLTKETHLCHCLCSTSDCLFIEEIYANAHLEGRTRYLLVDDLPKEKAFEVYEKFGFKDKKLVWDYINGKPGDMVRLFEMKKEGYPEKEALSEMLKDEIGRLEWILDLIEEEEKAAPPVKEIKQLLEKFKEKEVRPYKEVKGKALKFLISENILFYNPLEGTVRPQGRLIKRAIEEVLVEA